LSIKQQKLLMGRQIILEGRIFMTLLLRKRNFALFWLADIVSVIGDWMLVIGLPIYVYQLSHSTLATGLMFMVGVLPRLLLSSVGGVFADRWDRRRLMIIANFIHAVVLLPLLLVRSVDQVWIVYIVSLVSSVISQFFGPAANAFLPTLVEESELAEANSMNALSNNLSRLIGPPLGGIVAAVFGLTGIVWSDSFSFVIAAILIALVAVQASAKPATQEEHAGNPWRKMGHEWVEGMQIIWSNHNVFVFLILFGVSATGEGVMSTVFAPFVTVALHGGSMEMGWLMGAQAVGGIIGGLSVGWVARRTVTTRLFAVCTVIFGFIDLMIFNYPAFFTGIAVPIALFVLVGIPTAGIFASAMSVIQSAVPDEYRGRVFGTLFAVMGLMQLIGASLAGVLGDRLGPVLLLNIQGGGYVLAGVIAWFWLHHQKQNASEAGEQSELATSEASPVV
jgi:MFS family permease